ncbi:Conserved_hypothetical protein [Hexamita inflata]|uniref:Uncharacterized protein n=1 Tax=Hexamita inflata TaxID=28002 RepID=A0AA86UJA1_9EUKA|nr:Conserved hypothetical protein [Hexamita inflata]
MQSAIQQERAYLTQQFQEFLQQLDLLCIPQTNQILQKLLAQIPTIHQQHQALVNFDLSNPQKTQLWPICDNLCALMRQFRQDVFYFCAACQQMSNFDPTIKQNSHQLQVMIENLYKCCLNMCQFKSQFCQDMAIKRSLSRQLIRSPNKLQNTQLRPEASTLDFGVLLDEPKQQHKQQLPKPEYKQENKYEYKIQEKQEFDLTKNELNKQFDKQQNKPEFTVKEQKQEIEQNETLRKHEKEIQELQKTVKMLVKMQFGGLNGSEILKMLNQEQIEDIKKQFE